MLMSSIGYLRFWKMFWKKALALVIAIGFISGLSGCAKKVALPEDKKSYAGRWVATDGTFVQIYLDGGGDFKTSNSSVEGGSTKFKDNKMVIGMGPIEKEFVITEEPKANANGAWVVVLDGNAYTKSDAVPPAATATDATKIQTTSTESSTESSSATDTKTDDSK